MGGCPHHVIILVPQSSYLKSDLQHGLVGMVTLWYTCIHIHSDTTTDNASYKIRSRLKLPSNTLMTPPPRKHNHQDKAQSCTFWLRVPLYNIPHPSESKVKESNVPFPMRHFKITFRICSGVPCGAPGITGITGLNDRVIGSREQQDQL